MPRQERSGPGVGLDRAKDWLDVGGGEEQRGGGAGPGVRIDGTGGLPALLRPNPTWLLGKVEADLVLCPLVATVSLSRKGPEMTHPGEGTSGKDAQQPLFP